MGTITETLGLALMTWAISAQHTAVLTGMMVVAGAGTGLRFMPCTLHVSGIWADKIAPAMSLMRFALPFGGTLALTIMGSVFSNHLAGSQVMARLRNANASALDAGARGGLDAQSLEYIAGLPAAVQEGVRGAGRDAVVWAFVAIMPIMGLSVVTGLFLGNVWIKRRKSDEEKEVVEGTGEVVYVPYLWALMKVSLSWFWLRDADMDRAMSTHTNTPASPSPTASDRNTRAPRRRRADRPPRK